MQTNDQSQALACLAAAVDPMGQPPQRIDTVGAVLFCTRQRVLKLKRAVRYAFLDHLGVDARRTACVAELHLNRRTAPALYRGVRALLPSANGAVMTPLDPTGDQAYPDAIDWVVEMAWFEATFDELALSGTLTLGLLKAAVDPIAAFHRALPPVAGDGAAAVARVVEINRRAFNDLPPGALDPAAVADLLATTDQTLATVRTILDHRCDRGWMRHCHGDLHLGNLCLFDGEPLAFDALEFSVDLATTDVLYDIAFLVMDLIHRGMAEYAAWTLNRWCDLVPTGGDAFAVWPLFLSLRAAVRAHVEARRGGDHAVAAEDYLTLARKALQPPTPELVAVGGFSGTGKTQLALRLAPALTGAGSARHLRSDVARKQLAGVSPETRLPADAYHAAASAQVFATLADSAAEVLQSGWPVVVDAVFAREDERSLLEGVAAKAGVPFHGLWLEAPVALRQERCATRHHDASDADGAVTARQEGYDLGTLTWQRIDATGTPDSVLTNALTALGLHLVGPPTPDCSPRQVS